MVHRLLPTWLLAMLGTLLLGLYGCASSPPTRFYMLPFLTGAETAALAAQHDVTIGVGPVTLLPYLDWPQIVTRASRAQLHLAELDRWVASLQDTVARMLAENLSLLMPTARMVLHPWSRTTVIDRQVLPEVTQFDRTMGGAAVLVMRKARFSAPAAGLAAV